MNDINFICALLDVNGDDIVRDTDDNQPLFIDEDTVFHSLFKYNDISYEVIIRVSREFDDYVFTLIIDGSIRYYCFNIDYDDLKYYIYKDRIKEHFNNVLILK